MSFKSPYYAPNAKCNSFYETYRTNFVNKANALSSAYQNRVYTTESTSLVYGVQNSWYFDAVHLNEEGNKAFAQGLTDFIKSKGI